MASREYYIDYLKKTDRFPRSVYHRAKHEKVREIFERLPRGSSVLDAGCGIGNVTDRYCSEYKVAGIDEQPSAIQYCRRFCGGDYKESSLYDIPFADNTFDVVFFLDAIEHLTQPERALGELARVLKVGGSILVCTINYANPLWFILENTWHRFFGGGCKTYSKDVHPTRYTAPLLRRHCEGLFKEGYLQKCVIGMELFYLGMKTGAVGQVKSASGQDRCQR